MAYFLMPKVRDAKRPLLNHREIAVVILYIVCKFRRNWGPDHQILAEVVMLRNIVPLVQQYFATSLILLLLNS